jgi:hypothetical protein
MKNSPWLMWGGAESITLSATSPGQLLTRSVQLTQVRYGRPTTWRYFFAANLLGGLTTAPAPVLVDFNLTMGTGRSTVVVPSFEHYRFNPGIGAVAPVQKYSASVNGPVRDDSSVAPFPQNALVQLPLETVQIQAVVSYQANSVGDNVQIEVHSYFAPEVHIRPEWFKGEFSGDEDGGR